MRHQMSEQFKTRQNVLSSILNTAGSYKFSTGFCPFKDCKKEQNQRSRNVIANRELMMFSVHVIKEQRGKQP